MAIICHHPWLVVLAIGAVAAPVFRMSELQCARGPGSPHAEVEAFKDAEAGAPFELDLSLLNLHPDVKCFPSFMKLW